MSVQKAALRERTREIARVFIRHGFGFLLRDLDWRQVGKGEEGLLVPRIFIPMRSRKRSALCRSVCPCCWKNWALLLLNLASFSAVGRICCRSFCYKPWSACMSR